MKKYCPYTCYPGAVRRRYAFSLCSAGSVPKRHRPASTWNDLNKTFLFATDGLALIKRTKKEFLSVLPASLGGASASRKFSDSSRYTNHGQDFDAGLRPVSTLHTQKTKTSSETAMNEDACL